MTTRNIPFQELGLDRQGIWKESGNTGFVPDMETEALYRLVWDEISEVTHPSYGYETFRNEGSSPERLCVGGVSLNSGKLISGYLYGAEEFVVFVATAGTGFEEYQKSLKDSGDIVKCFFADMIGSAIAEHAGAVLYRDICRIQESKGFAASHSYSPGYCGWPVSDQKVLFSLLPDKPCGIRLTDSQLMLPIKSVSGIIGSGKGMKKSPHSCAICEMENCFRKKARKHEHHKLDI